MRTFFLIHIKPDSVYQAQVGKPTNLIIYLDDGGASSSLRSISSFNKASNARSPQGHLCTIFRIRRVSCSPFCFLTKQLPPLRLDHAFVSEQLNECRAAPDDQRWLSEPLFTPIRNKRCNVCFEAFAANVIAHALWTNFRGRFCLLLRLRWCSFLRRLGRFFGRFLRTVPSLCRLFRFGSVITHNKVKQWLAQLSLARTTVVPISNQFDMSMSNSFLEHSYKCRHKSMRGKEEFVVEKVPSRRPWKRP